ncbi:MAG: hypothetical protein AB1397_08370 [bacterium]
MFVSAKIPPPKVGVEKWGTGLKAILFILSIEVGNAIQLMLSHWYIFRVSSLIFVPSRMPLLSLSE